MSGFLGGGEKAGSSNPLKNISNREGRDTSLFRDRHVASRPSSSQSAFRPSAPQQPQSLHANPVPHPFNLSHLSAALSQPNQMTAMPPQRDFMAEWERAKHAGQPPKPPLPHIQQAQAQSALSQDFARYSASGPQRSASGSNWAESFDPKGKGRATPPLQQMGTPPSQMQSSLDYQRPYMSNLGMGYQPTFQPMYQNQGYHAGQQQPIPANGSMTYSQAEQEKMEAAFESALEDARAQTAAELAGESEAIRQDTVPEEEIRESKGELEKVWESLKPEAERLNKLAEWESGFSQFVNEEDDLYDVLNKDLHREDIGQTPLDQQMDLRDDFTSTDQELRSSNPRFEAGLPPPQQYSYTKENPYQNSDPLEAWINANALFSSGGSLTEVTQQIEHFLQSYDEAANLPVSRVEAWSLLGRVHAMNEKEEQALAAFEAGRDALQAGQGGENKAGEMLTNLAISYVNESEDLAALTTLHSYLSLLHPAHAGTEAPSRSRLNEAASPWELHTEMRDKFLNLARDQYGASGVVDPDVQVGLGTMYYMIGEYGEARNCWTAALGERPDDYLLWNRLGATLANGGKPEEAVDAYRRALELKPTFTRAIFNLGVACLNIGVHKEAAEHFLAALSMQPRETPDSSKAYQTNSLWSTLRRALVAMDLQTLAAQAAPGADLEQFRQAGFDF